MPDNAAGFPLYLFAKVPAPGAVKTRLRPHLNDRRCVELARLMLEDSAAKAAAHWPGRTVLCITPHLQDPFITALAERLDLEQILQAEGDLGRRMQTALAAGIARHGAAVVMGCDVPFIPADWLERSHRLMRRGANLIGPATDGGFYLLGLHHCPPDLFSGIRWGGAGVRAALLARAAERDLRLRALPSLQDIDRPEDLRRLAGTHPAYSSFARSD